MKADLEATSELDAQMQDCLNEKLSESERCYRELVESLREIVFRCDRKGALTFLNQAWTETLGYSKTESMERSISEFIHLEDREIALALITKPRRKEPIVSINKPFNKKSIINKELRFYHQNGQTVWLELSARHCSKEGLSGSLIDITERKRVQEVLEHSEALAREKAQQLEESLRQMQQSQSQLVHAEKMSYLGQLVAGIAHEINNSVNFIHGNLPHVNRYSQDMLHLLQLYNHNYPCPEPEIQAETEAIDLNFLQKDLPKSLSSMESGTRRIGDLVLALRNFAHLDEAQKKPVDIHEGMDSTLLILQNRLYARATYPGIQVIKEYGTLPLVNCYAGQMNQVFMNILTNAIDAIEESLVISYQSLVNKIEKRTKDKPQIRIQTEVKDNNRAVIRIADNGQGMTEEVLSRAFEPFSTTKPVGKGTGLGLSISYEIVVEKHGGILECHSTVGQGTEVIIEIPIQ